MRNADIRMEIKSSRLFYHEISERLNVHESSFYRMLRSELTSTQKQNILDAVRDLKKERAKEIINS